MVSRARVRIMGLGSDAIERVDLLVLVEAGPPSGDLRLVCFEEFSMIQESFDERSKFGRKVSRGTGMLEETCKGKQNPMRNRRLQLQLLNRPDYWWPSRIAPFLTTIRAIMYLYSLHCHLLVP